jgi:hypothetical protein
VEFPVRKQIFPLVRVFFPLVQRSASAARAGHHPAVPVELQGEFFAVSASFHLRSASCPRIEGMRYCPPGHDLGHSEIDALASLS